MVVGVKKGGPRWQDLVLASVVPDTELEPSNLDRRSDSSPQNSDLTGKLALHLPINLIFRNVPAVKILAVSVTQGSFGAVGTGRGAALSEPGIEG